MDETYIHVKGEWRYLYRAVDKTGQTIDGSEANEAAIRRYNQEHGTSIDIRRGVKRVMCPMLGFKSFAAAQTTLVGIDLMHMIKKDQLVEEAGTQGFTPAEQFSSLAA